MTDSKLRELERRWKETQSVQDEAAYLLERVRVGDLEREKLELAAYCGHEGAREAFEVRTPQQFPAWASGLARFGPVVCARSALVGARFAILTGSSGDECERLAPMLRVLDAYLEHPREPAMAACASACVEVDAIADEWERNVYVDDVGSGLVLGGPPPDLARLTSACLRIPQDPSLVQEALVRSAPVVGDDSKLRPLIEAELTRWALCEAAPT